MLKKKVKSLVLLGCLEKSNELESEATHFPYPKPKTNLARFLSDFRSLNKQLKCKLCPIPRINEI